MKLFLKHILAIVILLLSGSGQAFALNLKSPAGTMLAQFQKQTLTGNNFTSPDHQAYFRDWTTSGIDNKFAEAEETEIEESQEDFDYSSNIEGNLSSFFNSLLSELLLSEQHNKAISFSDHSNLNPSGRPTYLRFCVFRI